MKFNPTNIISLSEPDVKPVAISYRWHWARLKLLKEYAIKPK